ncbi:hypothetical protein ACHAXA_011447 [Cyclostephanos tholiformis]|uniref:Uncharacterized protein n=1 Tax=Cyclostephanos tholiformis TaxID=382380 RepID=A0ABD3RVW6_9STRA
MRVRDPIIQDFGSIRDWNAKKTGDNKSGSTGWNGNASSSSRLDRRVGDDDVNEGGGGGGRQLLRRRRRQFPPPPPPFLDDDDDDVGGMGRAGGGNFWINPTDGMDRFPSLPPREMVRDGGNIGGGLMMMTPPPPLRTRRRRDVAFNARRRDVIDGGRRNGNVGRPRGDGGGGGGWWETRRGEGMARRNDYELDDEDFDYYDDDYDYFVNDDDYYDDDDDDGYYPNRRGRRGGGSEYYGPPPPTRSRSSFRSGAPPPPRPIKQFYDKLFWFGFDPDATGPTDRTMFGGTRGKFNAIDLLRDREERQRRYRRDYDGDYDDGGGGSGNSSRRRRRRRGGSDPVIQDFGSVRDWDARKNGRGRVGGDAVGDDIVDDGAFPFADDIIPRPPPPGMPRYDIDARFDDDDYYLFGDVDEDDINFDGRGSRSGGRELQRRSRRGFGGGRQLRRRVDPRAEEYNRFLGLGPPPDVDDDIVMDDEYRRFPSSSTSRRRRKGFAYKYDGIDLLDDDGEYIDIEPLYATKSDLDMAREQSGVRSSRRRSWEDRAIEMDRVPPINAVAWGPNGPVNESPLDIAAMDALRDIKKSKNYLERKEEDVEDAKEKVVNLKADVSFYENKLDGARGREASKLEQELGYILRDVEEASLRLRLARAERDEASNRVSDLEERNWALLSEFEATKAFK